LAGVVISPPSYRSGTGCGEPPTFPARMNYRPMASAVWKNIRYIIFSGSSGMPSEDLN